MRSLINRLPWSLNNKLLSWLGNSINKTLETQVRL